MDYAISNEGPRIVEITKCEVDHPKGKCYKHRYTPRQNCCFHLENPFIQQTVTSCKCTRSHESPDAIPSLCREHKWLKIRKELLPSMGKCVKRVKLSPKTGGHVAHGDFHMCRRKNSELSPLLSTCSESRYEVQRLGILKYISWDANNNKTGFNHGYKMHPIYFKFGVDTLAIDLNKSPTYRTFKVVIDGLEKVKVTDYNSTTTT